MQKAILLLRYCYAFLCMIILFACANNTHTYHTNNSQPVILPSSPSLYYLIKTPYSNFKGRTVEIISGALSFTTPALYDSIVIIDLLKNVDCKNLRWSASFNIMNQQPLSVAMADAAIIIKVNEQLTLKLSGLDESSIIALMYAQENFISSMAAVLSDTLPLKAMADSVWFQKGILNYVSANALLDVLPSLYQYDGPDTKQQKQASQSMYITGQRKGNRMAYYWINSKFSTTSCQISFYGRLCDTSGKILKEYSFALPDTIKLFFVNHWSTHTEFLNFWKANCGGKPLPSLLLNDAGIVTRVALTPGWLSEMVGGSANNFPIIIRGEVFGYIFPIGQPVSACTGQLIPQ